MTASLAVPVTALYGGLCGLLIWYLAFRVTMYRKSQRVGMGDNNDKTFAVEIRAHANAVEYAPICLILLLLAEFNGLPAPALHVLGILIVGGRAAHAFGYIRAQGAYHPGRFWGIVFNWLAILVLGIANTVMYFL